MNWIVNVLLTVFRPALGLIILAGLLLYWVLKKKFPQEKFLKLTFYIFSSVIIFQSVFFTILNWWIWSKKGITQWLLPPHTSITYILKYSWYHYWFESMVIILTSIIVFFTISLLNKKFEDNLFYDEEKYLAVLGILATGWPNCLVFLCLVFFWGVFSHLIFILFNKKDRRLILLYFWIPCALLTLFLGVIISKYMGVSQLAI